MKFLYLFLVFFTFTLFSCTKPDSLKVNKQNGVGLEQLAETKLPSIYIATENKKEPAEKKDKIPSTVIIKDADGNEIFYDSNAIFSGRGNVSWFYDKKPFKIKLDKKVSILGMPESKQWMLIANYLDNSFMKNELAFFLSEKLGLDWTIHGRFVNLIKNNKYHGLYWLGEQIKVDKHRVNINDKSDYLLELDLNYDENWKFESEIKKFPYMIKNDDHMNEERLSYIKEKVSLLEKKLYGENFPYSDATKTSYDTEYMQMIDVETFAKYYLVNEISHNVETRHPKSAYFVFDTKRNILKAGPVWDFDWSGGDGEEIAYHCRNTLYFDALFKTVEFNEAINRLLKTITTDDISQKAKELKKELEKAVYYDNKLWGTEDRTPFKMEKENPTWEDQVDFLVSFMNRRLTDMKSKEFKTDYALK